MINLVSQESNERPDQAERESGKTVFIKLG